MKKSLISAVKKLLSKLGAEEIEGNNLVEVIDSGADAIKDGSGSGGGTKIVNITEGFDSQWSADATFSEMLSAYQSGKTILFSIGNATAIATYHAERGGLEPAPADFIAYLFELRGLSDVPAIVAFFVSITENDVQVEFGTIS